jgi:threonine synthase
LTVHKTPNDSTNFLDHLECTFCKRSFDSNKLFTLCPSCGKVLFAKYDLESAKNSLSRRDKLKTRSYDIWRFFEVMPVINPDFRFSLGEGWTPLIKMRNITGKKHVPNLFVKDEGQNPTGTFKSRGLCAAVSKACELGVKDFIIPSAGNAGAALAAYASYAGVFAHIFMPKDTPDLIQKEILVMGGDLHLIEGLITDAAEKVKKIKSKKGWFDVSTLKEPYRVEGKKTMGYEIVEQFDWNVPDVIIYPTGGGTGIIGMWKAFEELETLGIIGSERPRMVSVQSSGCAPICKAFDKNDKFTEYWPNAQTIALGLRIPSVIGDYLILDAIRESKGTAIAVSDNEIITAMKILARKEGIMLSPEAAATYAGLEKLLDTDFIAPSDSVVLFGTGSGLLYPDLWDM